jgi:hypothetical protein
LALGVVVSAWQAVRARNAEIVATEERDRAVVAEKLASERLAEVTKQKNRAEQAERKAAEEAAAANKVNAFLNRDLLGSIWEPARRGVEVNPNITVRETLAKPEAQIGERFHDQPLVEAAIRDTLGNTYVALKEGRLAAPHLERAVALRKATLGPDHDLTLEGPVPRRS